MNPNNSDRWRVTVALLLVQCALPCWTFSPGGTVQVGRFRHQTSLAPSLCNSRRLQNYRSSYKTVLMAKKTQPAPLPTIDDPYLLLGLDSRNPTTDKQEIKRAYRKRAMQYHPDVLLDQDSTEAEREQASKNFARVNAAYEMLTGGTKGNNNSGSTSTKTTSGGYNYQPPHRRSSSYSSSSSSSTRSTNWEDFMPNYNVEDSKYDAGGDSFGSIFSDLLTGAAGAAAGIAGSRRGGVFGDFIDFLEGNIDGFESGYDDDRSLSELLKYGSFDDIANEMDETDILVTSLETKQKSVQEGLEFAQADLNIATRFSEKLDIEERIAELKAREKVVKGYLKKGRNRLVRLRERYKELVVEGRGGRGYGSRSSESSASSSSYSASSSAETSSSYRATNPAATSSPSPSPPPPAPYSSAPSDKNWRSEGFSSSYGKSSSGRRSSRGSRRGNASVEGPSESSSPSNQQQQQQQQRRASETYSNRSSSTKNSSASSSASSPPKQYDPWVPPHRRTTSSTEAAVQDKKRLRELEVDDEFEKLKREMGM